MKDYSLFVNSAYFVTFVIILVFGVFTFWRFRSNSLKLNSLNKKQDGKKKK